MDESDHSHLVARACSRFWMLAALSRRLPTLYPPSPPPVLLLEEAPTGTPLPPPPTLDRDRAPLALLLLLLTLAFRLCGSYADMKEPCLCAMLADSAPAPASAPSASSSSSSSVSAGGRGVSRESPGEAEGGERREVRLLTGSFAPVSVCMRVPGPANESHARVLKCGAGEDSGAFYC